MRKQLQDMSKWHRIFAWFPHTTLDGQSVWLEPLERRLKFSTWFDDYFDYRIPALAAATRRAKTPKAKNNA